MASYKVTPCFKTQNNYIAENKSCSSNCHHTGTIVPSTDITKEKGSKNCFPLKRENPLLEVEHKLLKIPPDCRLNPKQSIQ